MNLRPVTPDDFPALSEIFYRAVREGAQRHYDAEARTAWAPEVFAPEIWGPRLEGQWVMGVEDAGRLIGFMSLTDGGYLDFAYVAPEVMGKGVADALYAALLEEAAARGLSKLTSMASHLSHSFFTRHGWTTIRRNEMELRGAVIHNWVMELPLAPAPDAV